MIESYLYGMAPITWNGTNYPPITLFVWNGTNYPSLFLLDFVYRIIEQLGA